MGLAAGKKTVLLTINKPGPKDSLNLPGAPVLHKRKWAQPRTVSGVSSIRDEAQGGINNTGVPYSFRVDFDESITQDMHVVNPKGTVFNIKRVIHDYEKRDHTDIVCETGRG